VRRFGYSDLKEAAVVQLWGLNRVGLVVASSRSAVWVGGLLGASEMAAEVSDKRQLREVLRYVLKMAAAG